MADKRARFSDDIKQRAIELARAGKVTREIGTELGLDKAQWQNIRLWTEKANVDLPRERQRETRKKAGGRPVTTRTAKAKPAQAAERTREPADPLAHILELIENPSDAIATLESERVKVVQRLNTIDKLLAVLRSGE